MANVHIEPDDYLDEASTSALASELRRRFKAGERVEKEVIEHLFEDQNPMDEALFQWRRGSVEDALFYLEYALGRDWYGLSEILARRAA